MSVRWHTYPDPASAAEACAHHISGLLEEVLSGQERASLAISGGETPLLLFRNLARSGLAWDRVHLFWVDERCVPSTDPQSNYRLAEEALITPARIPRRNLHRIDCELRPEHAARRYVTEIQDFFGPEPGEFPHFDVIHRGIGPDGHTASLFPGSPLIDDREQIAAPSSSRTCSSRASRCCPVPCSRPGTPSSSSRVEEKAEAVRNVFKAEYDPSRYPAQLASHHGRRVAWFLDQPAAALMD